MAWLCQFQTGVDWSSGSRLLTGWVSKSQSLSASAMAEVIDGRGALTQPGLLSKRDLEKFQLHRIGGLPIAKGVKHWSFGWGRCGGKKSKRSKRGARKGLRSKIEAEAA